MGSSPRGGRGPRVLLATNSLVSSQLTLLAILLLKGRLFFSLCGQFALWSGSAFVMQNVSRLSNPVPVNSSSANLRNEMTGIKTGGGRGVSRGKKSTKHEHRFSPHSVNFLIFAEMCFSGCVCEAGETFLSVI